MTQKELCSLVKKLPHRKNVILANRLGNVTPVQVKCVFSGEITDPQTVATVITAAIKLAKELEKLPRIRKSKKAKAA